MTVESLKKAVYTESRLRGKQIFFLNRTHPFIDKPQKLTKAVLVKVLNSLSFREGYHAYTFFEYETCSSPTDLRLVSYMEYSEFMRMLDREYKGINRTYEVVGDSIHTFFTLCYEPYKRIENGNVYEPITINTEDGFKTVYKLPEYFIEYVEKLEGFA